MAFNIDNYVDVPTRLAEALKRFPDLRIQETNAEVVTMPDGSTFYRCTVTVWRDANDPLPAIATAAEPYPGKTPYTKNSEFMVGMTSALGRALGYMGMGVAKAIASQNEVLARLDQPVEVIRKERPANTVETIASAKQLAYVKALARGMELNEQEAVEAISAILGRDDVLINLLSPSEATRVIEAWKK
jgi:hypothetical protein